MHRRVKRLCIRGVMSSVQLSPIQGSRLTRSRVARRETQSSSKRRSLRCFEILDSFLTFDSLDCLVFLLFSLPKPSSEAFYILHERKRKNRVSLVQRFHVTVGLLVPPFWDFKTGNRNVLFFASFLCSDFGCSLCEGKSNSLYQSH